MKYGTESQILSTRIFSINWTLSKNNGTITNWLEYVTSNGCHEANLVPVYVLCSSTHHCWKGNFLQLFDSLPDLYFSVWFKLTSPRSERFQLEIIPRSSFPFPLLLIRILKRPSYGRPLLSRHLQQIGIFNNIDKVYYTKFVFQLTRKSSRYIEVGQKL